MTFICPDCGAVDNGDGSCRDFFDSFLNLEFTNPDYGEVHALTVGTYMIQHYRYSDGALSWIKSILKEYLSDNWTGEKLRQVAKNSISSQFLKSGIIRSPSEPLPQRIKWKMTITDVARQYEDAKTYRKLVKEWARITLQQMDENQVSKSSSSSET